MTLLAPLTTALIGILGGVTLLLIYALRSRRRMVKVSSIRHWPPVADDTQASEPFRWPRPSWLLLIQFLILGSLAIAAGRPTVTGSDGGADTVLVIDCSASMAALGDDGVTRFDAARAVALREAERAMRGGGRVALIRADAAPQLVTGFTQSGAALRAVLGDLQQTDEAQDLATVPAILDGLLAGYESRSEGSERRPRRVLLIDDRAGVDPRLAGYQIEHRRIGGETTPRNVGIVKLAASRAADVPGAVRLLLEFVATRDAESAVVVLSLDGAEVERFPVSFGADRVARRVMTVAATEGVLTVSLQGGDALAADDSASLVIVPERRLTVGLVRRSGPMVEGSATDWLLEETLRALPRADVKVVRIGAVSGLIGTLAIGRIGAASHPSGGEIKLRLLGTEGALVVSEARPEVGVYYRNQPVREARQRRVASDGDFLLVDDFVRAIDTEGETILNARASHAIFATVEAALLSARSGQPADVRHLAR